MNRHEKIAWFSLAVMAFCSFLFIVIFFLMRGSHSIGFSLRIASSVFGLGAFMAFGPMIFKNRGPDESIVEDKRDMAEALMFDSDLDERDLMIQRTARMHSFGALWFLMVFGLIGTWMWKFYQYNSGAGSKMLTVTVNVMDLPLIVVGSFLFIYAIHSISTIIQYRSEEIESGSSEISYKNCKRSLLFLGYYVVLFPILAVFLHQGGVWVMMIGMMFGTGIMHFMVWQTRKNPGGAFTDGDIRLLHFAGKVISVLFIAIYFISIVVFAFTLSDLGYHPAMYVPISFFVLSTVIILTTIYPDIKNYYRKRRHEEA